MKKKYQGNQGNYWFNRSSKPAFSGAMRISLPEGDSAETKCGMLTIKGSDLLLSIVSVEKGDGD